ncbi:MAG: MBL fold metallo-hydrolase [Bacteroidetes bacterium]|nr:MAG: MBL fold metallo-hydrolase [Bacteroidota bacterium]
MINVESLPFNSFQVNCYAVWDETGECLVIDPCFYSKDEERIFEDFLSDNRLKITGQVNTHCHVDHVLGVGYLKSRYNLPFRAHREESPLVPNIPLMGDMFGFSVEPLEGIDTYIEDGEKIRVGNHELQAMLVPGHSPGSLAFYSPEGGFVVTGDALFAGSIGRTDLPGGDHDTLMRSIRERLMVLPPATIVYPGHGPSSAIARESAQNPFLNMPQ